MTSRKPSCKRTNRTKSVSIRTPLDIVKEIAVGCIRGQQNVVVELVRTQTQKWQDVSMADIAGSAKFSLDYLASHNCGRKRVRIRLKQPYLLSLPV